MRVIIEAWREDSKTLSDPVEGDHGEIAKRMREYADQGYTHMTAHRLDMVCDFCSEPSIAYKFQIEPGGVMGTIIADDQEVTHIDRDGLWGACSVCANFILTDEWDAMADRAIDRALDGFPLPPGFSADEVKHIIGFSIIGGPISCFRAGYEKTHPVAVPVISDEELLS